MKPSSPLSLKSLAAKIHHPLPLTPRESQKLLSLLTQSFRKQLDKEHPSEISHTKSQPTDAHVLSILSSPLLRKPDRDGPARPIGNGPDFVSGIGKAQSLLSDPMEYFQEQVAVGEATLETATMCLDAHRKNMTTFGNTSTPERTLSSYSSQAGATVLGWLRSSGLNESMEFVHDLGFVDSLMPFLIAEKKTRYVWQWISRLKENLSGDRGSRITKERETLVPLCHLLTSFISTRIHHFSDINGALKDVVRAIEGSNGITTYYARKFIWQSATATTRELLKGSLAGIDTVTVERMIALIPHWCSKGQEPSIRATLNLYQSVPNASPALAWICQQRPDSVLKANKQSQTLFVQICLQTSNVLLTQGKGQEASGIMSMLQEHFAPEIGHNHVATRPRSARRKSSSYFHSLAALGLD